jgi:Bacterial Ig-like domain (group 3)/FG-GAP-like repeat
MKKFLRIAVTPVVLATLSLAINLFERPALAQVAPHKTSTRQGGSAEPLLTGTDGSTTGVAKFQGNFTAITAPSGQVLALVRQANCALLFLTGTYSNGSTFTYTSTGMTPNYERVLHSAAGLTTTADSAPAGCVDPTKGIGSRPAVYVGKTTTGVNVYAGIFYNPVTNGNALYVLTGESTFSVSFLSFSMAGLMTTADLNGDGNGDLIVVNGTNIPGTAQVFVLLGNADGTFQSAVSYTVPGATSLAAVVDDFNGDNKLDIVATSDNGAVSLLTGKGDGTFNSPQSFTPAAPAYPGSTATPTTSIKSLISADTRGTGKRDIVGSNGLVLLNDGTGNFTATTSAAFPPLIAATNGGPYLASGDINKDGKADVVVSTGSNVLTYIGKGDGTFTAGLSYANVNADGFVTVTDLDGDGNLDIYIGDANGGLFRADSADTNLAYALMGNGDGSFSGAPTILGGYSGNNLGDVNGDSQQDLIVPSNGGYTVQLGTPQGSFKPLATTITSPPTTVVAGFNGPVTLNTANAIGSSYAVGDLNGDGKADLVYIVANLATIPTTGFPTTFPAPVYFVSLSNGDGTFKAPVGYEFPQIAPATGYDISLTVDNLHIGDFNHDGKADLIFNFNEVGGPTVTYLQGLVVLPGNGDGTYGSPIFTYTYNSSTAPGNGGIPSVASVIDLNGDGNADVLAFNGSFAVVNGIGVTTTSLQVYLARGDGTFNAPTTAVTSTKLASLVVADFNKDGKLDIACLGETAATQGQLYIALGNGNGAFATPTITNLNGGDVVPESGLAAADFDADGNIDLAYLNPESFSGIFYGKGDGTFTSVPIQNNNVAPKDLVNIFVGSVGTTALDLNKDGKPDILTGNTLLLNLYGVATTPTLFTTTTAIASSASSITVGGSVTFTATITPGTGSTGGPSGTVTFTDGTTTLGTGTIAAGKATYTTSALIAGSHSVTAVYAGDSAFSGSTSSAVVVTVNAVALTATGTTLSVSAVNGTAVVGTSLTFTGTVTALTGTATPTGIVTFTDGTATLGTGTLAATTGTLPTAKATFTTSALTVGTHNVAASYAGATPFSASSSGTQPLLITAAPASDFSITLSPATATVARSSSTTSTITITPVGGFKNSVQITVTGNPTYSTATTNATSLTPDGTNPVSTILTLQASTTTISQLRRLHDIEFAAILPLGLIGSASLFGLGLRRRRSWPLQLIALAAATVLLAATGCGGKSNSTNSTTNTPTPGTYTLTVTGTAIVGTGTLTHTGTFTVTVQ